MEQPVQAYFDISRPASKYVFLKAFEETTFLAQLLTAPFGLPSEATNALDKEDLLEEYTALYRLWEDVFSRLIYTKRGIPDDRVAATIHRYLEVKKDKRVLEVIEKAAGAMSTLIDPPSVLELAASECHRTDRNISDIVNTPKTAALLLDQVIRGIQSAFPHLLMDLADSDDSPLSVLKSTSTSGVDSAVKELYGVHVPIRIMSPHLLGTAAFAPLCLSNFSIDVLQNALNVTIDVGNGERITREFTLQQYYTLLHLHSRSEEVAAVLAAHSTATSTLSDLESLQNGALGLCIAVHPTVVYILQLRAMISSSTDNDRVVLAEQALRRVTGALQSRKEAREAAVIGDMHCALEAITESLEREYSLLEDEVEKEENEGEEEVEVEKEGDVTTPSVLPVYLQIQLLMDRAQYHLEADQHADALRDCNTVLSLDKRCVAAYALRSRLNPIIDENENETREGKEGKEGENKTEKDVENKVESEEEREASRIAKHLLSAASDALAAFLVGGSSDLSYASAAEEAARESCRVGARKIFEQRRKVGSGKSSVLKYTVNNTVDVADIEIKNTTNNAGIEDDETTNNSAGEGNDLSGSSLPRAWLVQSFFASYNPLRTSFGMQDIPPEEEIFDDGEEGDADALRDTVKAMCSQHEENVASSSVIKSTSDNENERSGVSSGSVGGGGDSCSDGDIDEGTNSRHTNTTHLPSPPSHLSDSLPLDPIGYWILRHLVARLEGTLMPTDEELAAVRANDEKQKALGYVETLGSWVGEAERMWATLCAEEVEELKEKDGDVCLFGTESVMKLQEMEDEKNAMNSEIDAEYLSMLKSLGIVLGDESDATIGYQIGLRMGGRGSVQCSTSSAHPTQAVRSSNDVLESVRVEAYSSMSDIEEGLNQCVGGMDLVRHESYTVKANTSSTSTSSSTSMSKDLAPMNSTISVPLNAPPCAAFSWCLRLLRVPEVAAVTGVTFSPVGVVLNIDTLVPPSRREKRSMQEKEKQEEKDDKDRKVEEEKQFSDRNRSAWSQPSGHHDCADDSGEDEEEEDWEDCDDDEEGEEEEGDGEGEDDDSDVWEDCVEGDDEDEEEEDEDNEEIMKKDQRHTKIEGDIESLLKSMRGTNLGFNANANTGKKQKSGGGEKKSVNIEHDKTAIKSDSATEVATDVKSDDSNSNDNKTKIKDISDLDKNDDDIKASIDDLMKDDSEIKSSPVAAEEESATVHIPYSPHASVEIPNTAAAVVDSASSGSVSATVVTAEDMKIDDVKVDTVVDNTDTTISPLLSRHLHARLLSLCSSIAYLAGDAIGAVECLRASVQENATAGGTLIDSAVKLGSLLIDMDQLEEAETILDKLQRENPKNAIIYLHQAEMKIHQNDFSLAVNLLRKAQKALQMEEMVTFQPSTDHREMNFTNLSSEEIAEKKLKRKMAVERRRILSKSNERMLSANVFALLGVAQFRCSPANPEISLRTLQEGIVKYPESLYLLLCTGEIVSQSGDAVKAIKCFKRASTLSPLNPLPYVNAARTYVMLNQSKKALAHLSLAIGLDECLASTRVDLSQLYLLSGKTQLALSTLQMALDMAKHVSEIRDVLTALQIATIQMKLQEQAVYYPPAELLST